MYNQSFSPKLLFSCTTQVERRNSGLKKEEFIEAVAQELGTTLTDGSYRFQIRRDGDLFLNGRYKSDFGYLCQNLVLRKLHHNIKRIYSVQQADRNTIVRQLKMLLSEDVDMWVVRLDVRHFYESIDRAQIMKKLKDDARLSYQTLSMLQSLFASSVISAAKGLPRGLGVSAALSEMYLKYFDLEMKRIAGVYFYARFVDDIIAVCSNKESSKDVWQCAVDGMTRLELELNLEKSYIWNPVEQTASMTYLGYTFKKNERQLSVYVSCKKQNVIKTRLTRTFVRYAKDNDYDMLKMRVKYLTGNFTLYRADTLAPIKVGIFFNYKMATDTAELDELDAYYQRLLHCRRGKLGSRIALTREQLKTLEKYSFRFGFENHVNHHFTVDQVLNIKSCWQ